MTRAYGPRRTGTEPFGRFSSEVMRSRPDGSAADHSPVLLRGAEDVARPVARRLGLVAGCLEPA